ncbi:MAG: hypothetical protein JW837_00210 [Sedimentisphaerales bacterium]|nr:hypothetical protein [Sedimentisphaerales bacterium]
MKRDNISHKTFPRKVIFFLIVMMLLSGCNQLSEGPNHRAGFTNKKIFILSKITPEQAKSFLSELGINKVSASSKHNAVIVTGSEAELDKAGILLELVDSEEDFMIEVLAHVSAARTVPTNEQIAEALGDITIGMFAEPPTPGEGARAIIDIHGESVVAIIPARFQREMLAFVKFGHHGLRRLRGETEEPARAKSEVPEEEEPKESVEERMIQTAQESDKTVASPEAEEVASLETLTAQVPSNLPEPHISETESATQMNNQPEPVTTSEVVVAEKPRANDREKLDTELAVDSEDRQQSTAYVVTQDLTNEVFNSGKAKAVYESVPLANGEDVLQLDLPEKLEMIQLLDLVAEYLNLDCMYDPQKIRGQIISLRFHGQQQGSLRVKDLYPLLESVLKFKGFAMTCHKGNLVTIVPLTDALDADPALLDPDGDTIRTGDMVVTRTFNLQHIDISSAMNLLNNMKLGMTTSPIDETQTLIVTCYAHRMARIEQLLDMVDRPGRSKEYRFRALKYTKAQPIIKKIETLVVELQAAPVKISPVERQQSESVLKVEKLSRPSSLPRSEGISNSGDVVNKYTVFLEADERTDRILMIGYTEQLAIVEKVIDSLDVATHDPRNLKVYDIVYLNAADVEKKLNELDIFDKPVQTPSAPSPVFVSKASPTNQAEGVDSMQQATQTQIKVTVLEATNSLLVNATNDQHNRIASVIKFVDVAQQDMRTLKVYNIKHVDAEEVKNKLAEFELIGKKQVGNSTEFLSTTSTSPRLTESLTRSDATNEESVTRQDPQVAVLESTNSLLINATEFQHTRMADIINHVDTEIQKEAIPYEIYFLENQDPETLAEVLGKLVQETVTTNKDDKIEKVTKKTSDQIIIVPDKGTFSLVVYASKKNQDWISKLIKDLDRRRPQVLIDVTLVEIRKTDEFNYDLNLISSFPDLLETGGQTGSFLVDETTTVIDKLLQPSMRDRFVDFQANSGLGTGFYADKHINALLTAIQTKNYGRVLANPKVLVNDNEKGNIKTSDTTYIAKTSSIPVASGGAGPQTDLIQTALDYEPYEAGITLDITPHISEGKLLRLEIELTRSDFVNVTGEKPPDQTGSDVKTVVTVPDGSTIILGGMLKLNQTKGGSKVPILGDLPLVGGAFRSISNSDIQSKLYVFVRAEIIRPKDVIAGTHEDLERISKENRAAFEKHEKEFQNYENIPGAKPKSMDPSKVLEAR